MSRGRMTHELKTWPEPFSDVLSGCKKHEIRRADRDFQVGDYLDLREWEAGHGVYTGRNMIAEVTYVTRGGEWGLPSELAVLSIRVRWIGKP